MKSGGVIRKIFKRTSLLLVVFIFILAISVSAMGVEKKKVIERVTISSGVSKIWRNAFCGCKKLKRVELPNSLTLINKTAFSECGYRLKLYCKKNSLAMAFATKNDFEYRII